MSLHLSRVLAAALAIWLTGCSCDSGDPDTDGGAPALPDAPDDGADEDGGSTSPEVCDNGLDDDADGAIDCEDSECLAPPPAAPEATPRTFLEQVRFLYEGASEGPCAGMPIQRDVAGGLFDPERAAVVRGRVLDEAGAPLPGARVEVIGEPSWGWTESRADGQFDLVVHGGGVLRLSIVHPERLPAERIVHTRWNDYAWARDVALLRRSTVSTRVELGGSMSIARGERVRDGSGERQATLLFPGGTQAFAQMPGGGEVALSSMSVRVTEYTVGERGPIAMAAELPDTSGYTYAFEVEVDEAVEMGASGVRFDRPVPIYVENFLAFAVGTPVPIGFFDRERGAWAPLENGRVVEVAAIDGGRASFDLDGDGTADDEAAHTALGIDAEERTRVGATHAVGAELWRVTTTHFSLLDCNWPFGLPPDARAPEADDADDDELQPDSCPEDGSIIECENRTLGETVPLAGTSLALHYRSDRVPGRADLYELRVPLVSEPPLPPSLRRIETEVHVAGQLHRASFAPRGDAELVFRWDGRNAFGTRLPSAAPYAVRIGYVYGGVYMEPDDVRESFARFGYRGTASTTREEVTLWVETRGTLGGIDARAQGLGGLTLTMQHAYDPVARVLYMGDGRRRSVDALGDTISRFAGRSPGGPGAGDGGPALDARLWYPSSVAIAPDGTVYVADSQDHRVRAIAPDGTIRTVAGTGVSGNGGDEGPATSAQLSFPFGVEVGPMGDLFVVDTGNHRVRRIDRAGVIHAWAGNGTAGFSGDGGPAIDAQLDDPRAVAFAPDGRAYVADRDNGRVRYVDVHGVIHTIAGRATGGSQEDGIPARDALLRGPSGVAIAPSGGVYVSEQFGARVRWIRSDGVITTIAGARDATVDEDGGRATEALVEAPVELAIAGDGSLLIAQQGGRIRRVSTEGVITTIAGGPTQGSAGVPGAARRALLSGSEGIAVAPDGSILVAERLNSRVVRIAPALPRARIGDVLIPSDDAREVYVFDAGGRHLRTLDALLGIVRWQLEYDATGRLSAVVDRSGNRTTVERSVAGAPAAIVGPYGLRTTLRTDPAGWLDLVRDPAGSEWSLGYVDAGGLLATFVDAGGASWAFTYDEGALRGDRGPEGMSWTLAREVAREGSGLRESVSMTSSLGRVNRGVTERLADGTRIRRVEREDGTATEVVLGSDRIDETRHPDGTIVRTERSPDPRFGMVSSVAARSTLTLPSGAALELRANRTVTLAEPADPLSVVTAEESLTRGSSTWVSRFDAATRTWTSRSPRGRTQSLTLDERGRPVTLAVPGLAPVTFAYDARGRVREIAQRVGDPLRDRVVTFEHALDGAPDLGPFRRFTDGEGNATIHELDVLARPQRAIYADDHGIGLAWDERSILDGVSPPGRALHQLAIDGRSRLAGYVAPELAGRASTTSWAYDADGRTDAVTTADATTIDWVYEDPITSRGRLDRVVTPEGATVLRWDDAAGRVVGLSREGRPSVSATYDGARLESLRWEGDVRGAVDLEHDATTFRVSALRVSGATGTPTRVAYGYDADDMITSAGGLTVTWDAANGLLRGTSVQSTTTTYQPSSFGESDSMRTTWPGGSFEWTVEARDRNGRIRALVERRDGGPARRIEYGYDARGRLRTVDRDGVRAETYELDANGNRTSWTSAIGASTAVVDGRDRVASTAGAIGTATYVHDERGRLRERRRGSAVTRYDYDSLGSLLGVTLEDGRRIDYTLDALGRRVARSVGGAPDRQWIYLDAIRPIAELDASGQVRSVFVYATRAHVPDLMLRGGRTYRFVTDPTGSVRAVVDAASGEVAQELDYDAFGRVLRDTAPGLQPFAFAGGLYDPDTGLVRFGARDYDPSLGRWTARDPILFDGGQANLYEYAGGDPVGSIDPSGLFAYVCASGNPRTGLIDVNIEIPIDYIGPNAAYGRQFNDVIQRGWSRQVGRFNLRTIVTDTGGGRGNIVNMHRGSGRPEVRPGSGEFYPEVMDEQTILHETGHMLGLGHADDVDRLMFPYRRDMHGRWAGTDVTEDEIARIILGNECGGYCSSLP